MTTYQCLIILAACLFSKGLDLFWSTKEEESVSQVFSETVYIMDRSSRAFLLFFKTLGYFCQYLLYWPSKEKEEKFYLSMNDFNDSVS